MTPDAPEPPESATTPPDDPGEASGEAAAPQPPDAVTAGDAPPPGDLDASGSAVRSRADLQAELRQAHKAEHKAARKEAKHKHRWRRRSIWALCTIVVLAGLGIGGLYFYAQYRYDQIKKIHSRHLVTQSADPLKPFNVLLVGSDSRAFVGNNATLSNEIGNEANAGGQRSDVTMVARFNPAAKTVTVLSIPRDLWVDIPGNDSGISGMNRINAAYDSGPDLLIQTIEKDLGIKINHYIAVDFPGFSDMVNALGGITMDFPTAVKDAYTGLDVTQTGCQTVNGTVALQLVRSRHLYYMNSNGYWEGDGLSDFSRIQRQDAFFRAVLAKVNTSITDPFAINSFIGASVGHLTIDDTLTESELFHIAEDFRGLQSSHLITETLPVTSFVTDGGADVLQMAQPYALNMIGAFNAIGTAPPTTPVVHAAKGGKGTPTTTTTTLPHGTGERRRPQRVERPGQCAGGTRVGNAAPRRLHDRRGRERVEPPDRHQLRDPLRPRRPPVRADAERGAARPGDDGGGPRPQRLDGPTARRGDVADRLDPVQPGPCRELGHGHDGADRADDDHHDDDPARRLHEHPEGAVEPVPLHTRARRRRRRPRRRRR